MKQQKAELTTLTAVAKLLAVILVVATLYLAKDVFIPLALGLLLTFLLSPVVNRLQRAGISNLIAVVATATLAFVLLAGLLTLMGRELTTLVGDLEQYKSELVSKARGLAGLTTDMGGSLDELAEEVTEAMEEATESEESEPRSALERLAERVLPMPKVEKEPRVHDGKTAETPLYTKPVKENVPLASWASTVGTFLGPLATAGLVTVFALFMLVHREDLRDRIIAIISNGNYVTTTEALVEASQRISRYLLAQTAINTSYGIVLTLGLTTIGTFMTEGGAFPNAVLWGVLALCLRFVPYIGPFAAAAFPLAIALAVFPGYSVFLAVLALIVTMELISNNVIEPWLYGTSSGISAVAVIFAAVFWGWLWGPVGLLLSTPLTVCLVVLGQYVPRFKVFSTLLGEKVDVKPAIRFYHRLLADDEHRARELLQAYIEENSLDQACDEVLIPALKNIRSDHDAEQLDDCDAERLFDMVSALIDEIRVRRESEQSEGESPDSRPSDATADETVDGQANTVAKRRPVSSDLESLESPKVIGCISHHPGESLILDLMDIAAEDRWTLGVVGEDMLPQEVGKLIARADPAVVVIVVLPPGGFEQARYLCQSIREAGYSGAILANCMGKFKNFDSLFVKFRKLGATTMTTSFTQTRSKIESIVSRAEPVIAAPREMNSDGTSDTAMLPAKA